MYGLRLSQPCLLKGGPLDSQGYYPNRRVGAGPSVLPIGCDGVVIHFGWINAQRVVGQGATDIRWSYFTDEGEEFGLAAAYYKVPRAHNPYEGEVTSLEFGYLLTDAERKLAEARRGEYESSIQGPAQDQVRLDVGHVKLVADRIAKASLEAINMNPVYSSAAIREARTLLVNKLATLYRSSVARFLPQDFMKWCQQGDDIRA